MLFVQQNVMPLLRELRRVFGKEIREKFHRVIRVVDRSAADGIVRPDPGVLMVVHIMAQLMQAEQVMEIIPRHAAQWELADQAADDDA